ncbi:hypothetical protein SAMN05428966_10258 [Massilia sp. PDC64]|nr:hypothetical protein [Massilia sp. PDC64]SDC65883.1 hypothetical protein SAMN05428966_10258 [Massilia sp. PDC64]
MTAAARADGRLVTRVFHPAPEEALVHLANGVHAHVETGPAGYQLTTGERIEL